ncbi:hypothetical protein [Streptomyces sp. AB3(2024)]|uniref:hypothetical protein n=1 Tax=Streptomyces sp. AB3(2024) TaxID=3317321 RepID=UPI0035A28665
MSGPTTTAMPGVLAEHGLVPAALQDGDGARTWLREALGLHSLVRAMDLNFREVRFFRTAAVADEEAGVDGSVTGSSSGACAADVGRVLRCTPKAGT